MMSGRADLWIAALLMLLGAGVRAVAWAWSERRLRMWAVGLTVALVVSGPILSDSMLVARLPLASIIIWANPVPLIVGILVRVILRACIARWRRALAAVALGGVAVYSLVSPVMAKAPPCGDRRDGDVCLQMQTSTCGPAAAATLRVRITSGDADGLRALELPALVHVTLSREMDARDPRYSRGWGWIVGVTHTVVVYRFFRESNTDLVEVGDPAFGRERWEARSLADLRARRFITLEARTR